MKRSVIGGKVMRAPDLERIDERRVPAETSHSPIMDASSFKVGLYEDNELTRARDKALLVALGVDGDVPLAQARVNAGLGLGSPKKRFADTFSAATAIKTHFYAANDNHKIAVAA